MSSPRAMAGAVERIERDLAMLEEAIAAIAQELRSSYSSYLTALGQAASQQLILASYHLCTQGYPEAFLGLAFRGRQQLQQSLREIAAQAKQQLPAQLHQPNPEDLSSIPPEDFLSENTEKEVFKKTSFQLNPLQVLLVWQENLEEAIAKILQTASRDSNRLLQKTGILPKKLPEPVLEAAAKVEATAESVGGMPNLLNLVIESENDDEPQSSTVTHIYAIHLRLAEIELADPTVMAHRHQIRHLSARLHSIEREYQKKQRERAIAEAELAWRTSWFDD